MLNSFRKKLTEIKADINNKIDHLEVDKNQLFNKLQRKIDPKLTLNGVDYFLKKEESLIEIQESYREIERTESETEKSVHECFIQTTNFYHSMKTIEKEFNLIAKSIESLNVLIENIEALAVQVNTNFTLLSKLYDEKAKREHENQLKLNEIQNIESMLNEEDEFNLKEKSVKLALTLDD